VIISNNSNATNYSEKRCHLYILYYIQKYIKFYAYTGIIISNAVNDIMIYTFVKSRLVTIIRSIYSNLYIE